MNALEISNLKKTYASGVEALKGISLSVEEGDFYALLGPNGAGKSTTIGIVSSLVTKSDGNVSIFGTDIDQDFAEAKRKLGVVAQEMNFSPFEKVLDIVVTQSGFYGIPKKVALARAEEVLHKLGLWEKKDLQSRTLSGGLKRRLMIAKSLIHQPRLLILDEPTAGVDIELRRGMWDFIRELNKNGTTVILTTHYLEEAEQLCKNIAIIDKGLIVENTSMKDLLKKLDMQTFILDLETNLDTLPAFDEYIVNQIDPSTLRVALNRDQSLNAFFQNLSKLNIQVKSLRNEANRLEELFLQIIKNDHEQ
jgi:ABC-2 type transport system ATP-binding protein|tara:strand:- start:2401 stop:3321 length:921 start_codon:yes stop_codon:yes gene_type:complete